METGRIALYTEPTPERTIVKAGSGFTIDELFDAMPQTVTLELKNPAPPQPPKE